MQESAPLRVGTAILCAFCTLLAAFQYGWLYGFRAISLLAFVGLGLLYYWALPLLQGRLFHFSLWGGAVFALCQAVGEVMQAATSMRDILLLFLAFWPLYTALVCAAFTLLDRWQKKTAKEPTTPGRLRTFFAWLLGDGKKTFLALWGLIALCWLPYYILFFPGLATADTVNQMSMGLGFWEMSSHHPPIHSWWMAGCMQLGRALFGTYGAGVALATTMQSLLMALLAAATLRYMARLEIGLTWRGVALALYALCPLYGWYSVTLWKDVWLACFGLLFLLCCVDIARQRAAYFKNPGRIALLALAVLGLIVSKNNGVYVFALAVLVLIIALKGVRRQMAAVLVLGLVCSQLITGPLYNALNVQKGNVREALSIPLLQIAYVVRNADDAIDPADKAIISELLPYYDELHWRYDSNISDNVKEGFSNEAFAADPGRYLSLYVRLGLQQPKLYLRAALEHTFAYYFPDTLHGTSATTPYPTFIRENPKLFEGVDPMQGQYTEPLLSATTWIGTNIGNERRIPGLSMLFSIGMYFWALLFCGLRAWYKKQHVRLLALAAPVAVWLTCLASPVNGSMRYGFLAVMVLPFLLGYMLDAKAKA